jgi:hypothetical protein
MLLRFCLAQRGIYQNSKNRFLAVKIVSTNIQNIFKSNFPLFPYLRDGQCVQRVGVGQLVETKNARRKTDHQQVKGGRFVQRRTRDLKLQRRET